MSKRFTGLKARNYKFLHGDGSSRDVIALYAGSRNVGFMEYDTARKFVDRVHDLCDDHERKMREEQHGAYESES